MHSAKRRYLRFAAVPSRKHPDKIFPGARASPARRRIWLILILFPLQESTAAPGQHLFVDDLALVDSLVPPIRRGQRASFNAALPLVISLALALSESRVLALPLDLVDAFPPAVAYVVGDVDQPDNVVLEGPPGSAL